MFSIASCGSNSKMPQEVLAETLEKLAGKPSFILGGMAALHDAQAAVKNLPDGVQFHGSTSCLGIMTEDGAFIDDGKGCGFIAISDDDGEFGSAIVPIKKDDVAAAAEEALLLALERAGRPGEAPELIWLTSTPGAEEQVIAGIQEVIGEGIPICGGSAADNKVVGNWFVFDKDGAHGNAVAVSVFFPSVPLGYAFHSGYRPTSTSGTVTQTDGRHIVSIDNKPAADIYNGWTEGAIKHAVSEGGNVLSDTTLNPLGRRRDAIAGFDYFLLSHPDSVTKDGALSLFSDIAVGDEITLMEGTSDNLVQRASRVAEHALEMARLDKDQLAGALVIYCAGCMLTVQDRMDEVAQGLQEALGNKPFLGNFTFGEQGCFIGGSNHHGNLMISVVVFGSQTL